MKTLTRPASTDAEIVGSAEDEYSSLPTFHYSLFQNSASYGTLLKLKHLWSKLRESFWFLPALIVAFSTLLALGLIKVDSSGSQDWMADWPRLFGAGAEGARVILATITGSMMTVVGVTFSMTLVTLALASSQYTSRILRSFMGDHATQVVIGIFAGIFTYGLIVLRAIRG